MTANQPYRLIISGGGTGGHIFPAIAIARAFQQRHPDADILFVGAEGKMEMTRVPQAGFKIVGLRIAGLQRKLTLANFSFPFKLISSYFKARGIVRDFKPHAVIGTGGYASGPMMLAATSQHIPSLIQEQNSYAGITNKRLGSRVQAICVAYMGMEKYFPAAKVRLTGNPVRQDIINLETKRQLALDHFGFSNQKRTLLVLGGSLGARTINETMLQGIDLLIESKVQVIWQTGKLYYESVKAQIVHRDLSMIRVHDFLMQMDLAYAASDTVVSRAGALSISELCLAKKPSILVPSPNVAEDHQTKNAMALVLDDAALMVNDSDAPRRLIEDALKLMADTDRCRQLSENIGRLGKPNAAIEIVEKIEELVHEA